MSGREGIVSTQPSTPPLSQVDSCTESRVFLDYHCQLKLSALTSATLKERGNVGVDPGQCMEYGILQYTLGNTVSCTGCVVKPRAWR
jgi:hypothetical protein